MEWYANWFFKAVYAGSAESRKLKILGGQMKGKVLGRVTELTLTQEQYDKLQRSTTGRGGHQSLCQRVYESVVKRDDKLVARVYEVDMERIRLEIQRPDRGTWQDNFRAIMSSNYL